MKAILVREPNVYGLVDLPEPGLEDGQVLVRVGFCGICASDFEILSGINAEEVVYPIVPGHEWTGRVVKAAPDVPGLIGKRVTGCNVVVCGACGPCRKGSSSLCEHRREIGFSLDGAYAEYVAVPGANVIELPENVDGRTGTLAEPLAVCLHAVRLAGMAEGQKVLVLGDGPIGLLSVILARRLGGGTLMIAGHHSERLELCGTWTGAATVNTRETALEEAVLQRFGSKADLILETTGSPAVVSSCMGLLGYEATLCLVGSYRGRSEFSANDMVLFEQTVVGSLSYTQPEMAEAVDLLADGLLDGMGIITHTFPLEEYAAVFDVVTRRKDHVIKGCFEPGRR